MGPYALSKTISHADGIAMQVIGPEQTAHYWHLWNVLHDPDIRYFKSISCLVELIIS